MKTPIVRRMAKRVSFCRFTVSVTCVLACVAGCAMPAKAPVEPSKPAAEAAPPRPPEARDASTNPEPDQKTLAAIEDFLTRTQQYRQTTPILGTNPPPPKPSVIGQQVAGQPKQTNPPRPPSPEAGGEIATPKQAAANSQLLAGEPLPPQPMLPIPAVEKVTIQWNEDSEQEETPLAANAANTPMTTAASEREPGSRKMVEDLEVEAESRKDFDSYYRLKMAELATARDEDAAETVTQLPSDAALLLSALVNVSSAVRATASDPLDQAVPALSKIDELRSLVARQADPTVSDIALCRKVLTFGAYEAMPHEEFVSGRTIQLIVYSEIDNFRSRKTDEGAYETQLATKLEVFTKAGELVWHREEPEVIDTCRSLRRDFFVAQRVTLPPTLPAGDYVLKVRVEDKLAAKAGEGATPFTIHSPISVAKKP